MVDGHGKGQAPPLPRLALYSSIVFMSHLLSGVFGEYIFLREGFAFPALCGAIEFGVLAMIPLVTWLVLWGPAATIRIVVRLCFRSRDMASYALCGAILALSQALGLAAYVHINYTTAMVFGAVRLPTVMLIGAFVNRGAPAPWSAYPAALLVTVGLCTFGFAERRDAPRFDLIGLLLVAASAVLAALAFNLHQRILQRKANSSSKGAIENLRSFGTCANPAVTEQLMAGQYITGACLLTLYSLRSGEFDAFGVWCRLHNSTRLTEIKPIACGALLTAVGVRVLFQVVGEFDASRAALVTSLRKLCTFALSFVFFPKVFSRLHFVGIVLTVGGSFVVNRCLHSKADVSRSAEEDSVPSSEHVLSANESLMVKKGSERSLQLQGLAVNKSSVRPLKLPDLEIGDGHRPSPFCSEASSHRPSPRGSDAGSHRRSPRDSEAIQVAQPC